MGFDFGTLNLTEEKRKEFEHRLKDEKRPKPPKDEQRPVEVPYIQYRGEW